MTHTEIAPTARPVALHDRSSGSVAPTPVHATGAHASAPGDLARSPGADAATRRRAQRRPGRFGVVVAGTILAALVVFAAAPGLVAPHGPTDIDPINSLRGPSRTHLFGTDQLGRDIFSRVIHGARPSLIVGLAAALIGVAIGSLLGLLAGFWGGKVESVLMRLVDVLMAFPALLLALTVVAILGPGTRNVALAVGFAQIPGVARLTRAEVLRVKGALFVEAARAAGERSTTILRRHVAPNALGAVLVLGTINTGTAMLAASGLSFLGMGAKPPSPEWGSMIAVGRDFVSDAWWMAAFPGLAVAITVISVSRISRWLRHDDGTGAR